MQDLSDGLAASTAEWAHDAKNIMCHVVAMLHQARRQPERADLLEAAYQAVLRVSDVFDSTLDIAKSDAGKWSATEEVFCLRDELRAIEQMFAWSMKRFEITFTIDCPDDVATAFKGDAKLLNRILVNLVQNAFKFTQLQHKRSGGGAITLRVLQVSDLMVQFSIVDNGPGMSAEVKTRLFKAFQQAPETASLGTGLGLSICRRLADLMEGTILVESELEVGSTFILAVPLEVVVPVRTEVAIEAIRIASTSPLRVLVIDDDVVSAFMLHKQICAFGAEVVVAHSCAEARVHLQNGDYGAVFVDNRLPDGRGLQLIEELRARTDRGGTKPRIISCSGGLAQDEISSYCSAGVALFLPKPVAPDAIMDVLNGCRTDNGRSVTAAA